MNVLFIVLGLLNVVFGAENYPRWPSVEKVIRVSVEEPFRYEWEFEKPLFKEGLIIVISDQREFLRPRQLEEPILYVNGRVAARFRNLWEDGRLVAYVPLDGDGKKLLAWFGTPSVPEEITVSMRRNQIPLNSESKAFPLKKQRARRLRDRSALEDFISQMKF